MLERYFAGVPALFLYRSHAEIDRQRGYTVLDKELVQVRRRGTSRPTER